MAFDARWKIRTLWMLVLTLIVSPGPMAAQDAPAQKEPAVAKTDQEQYFELMQVFVDTFEQVERNYVKNVDRRRLMEAAVRGMLEELDPYSSYISPEELQRFNQSVRQEFGGIGIQVDKDARTGRILVISPLPDTPAYKAGVRAGDIITEVQGEDTENMPIARAVELMKGPPGDEVKIKVVHAGSNAEEEFKMQRAIIKVKSVLGDRYNKDGQWDFMLDPENGIAYVRLTQFGEHSAEELGSAVKSLQEAGMKGLILDLRFNPGGLLDQAIQISDLFIESGTIVSTEGKNTRKRTWSATKPGTLAGVPMAILVNRFSASASEIVSACLQDHQRAKIIGERTFGKGSVQNVIDLEGGSSALKLTTAGYMRPSGKNIHRFEDSKPTDEWGVKPDDGFEITMSREEMEQYSRYRRERDILRTEGPPATEFQDKQREKALEYLRSAIKGEAAKPAVPVKEEPKETKQAA